MSDSPPLDQIDAAAYRIPTDGPEGDGTLAWDATTVVVVRARAGDLAGLGYAYGHPSAVGVVETLAHRRTRGRGGRWRPGCGLRMTGYPPGRMPIAEERT